MRTERPSTDLNDIFASLDFERDPKPHAQRGEFLHDRRREFDAALAPFLLQPYAAAAGELGLAGARLDVAARPGRHVGAEEVLIAERAGLDQPEERALPPHGAGLRQRIAAWIERCRGGSYRARQALDHHRDPDP